MKFTSDISDKTKQERIDEENKKIVDKYFPETFIGVFRSINEWIVEGIWNTEAFVAELQSRYMVKEPHELSHYEKLLVYNFWDLQQEDIDEGFPELVQKAYDGDASFSAISRLLVFTNNMKKNQIPFPCEVDYNNVMKGVEKRFDLVKKGIINEELRFVYADNDSIENEAIKINKYITDLPMKSAIWENRERLIKYLQGDRSISIYELNNKIYTSFDDEMLTIFINKYSIANNHDKMELMHLIKGINFVSDEYSDEKDIRETKKNYNRLEAFLECNIADSKDSISSSILRRFKNELQTIQSCFEKRVSEKQKSNEDEQTVE